MNKPSSQTAITKKEWNKHSYGTELVSALQDAFPPEKIKKTLARMLEATIETKGGNIRPDYRTREKALALWMNYSVGTPVQRQEQVNYNMDMKDLDEGQLIQKLSQSPALLKQMKKYIEEAEHKAAIEC